MNKLVVSLIVLTVAVTSSVSARDYISIVGSSTVYPFATLVAEKMASEGMKAPVIESTGSGGGHKLFCAGVGVEHPDITNSSRAQKDKEFALCQEGGVNDIVEVRVGNDGIAFAYSADYEWKNSNGESLADGMDLSNEEIDDINILNATMKAMLRATDIAYKKYKFNKIYVDGPYYNTYIPPGENSDFIPHECINKGDSIYTSIAAASILAKEQHNENIHNLVSENSELEKYDLLNNHGYGTKKHLEAIQMYGITKWHRKSFGCCKYANIIKLEE